MPVVCWLQATCPLHERGSPQEFPIPSQSLKKGAWSPRRLRLTRHTAMELVACFCSRSARHKTHTTPPPKQIATHLWHIFFIYYQWNQCRHTRCGTRGGGERGPGPEALHSGAHRVPKRPGPFLMTPPGGLQPSRRKRLLADLSSEAKTLWVPNKKEKSSERSASAPPNTTFFLHYLLSHLRLFF